MKQSWNKNKRDWSNKFKNFPQITKSKNQKYSNFNSSIMSLSKKLKIWRNSWKRVINNR